MFLKWNRIHYSYKSIQATKCCYLYYYYYMILYQCFCNGSLLQLLFRVNRVQRDDVALLDSRLGELHRYWFHRSLSHLWRYISQLLARGSHHTAGQQRSARPSCPPPHPPPHHPLIPCVFITSSLHCPAYICCSLSMPHTLYVMYNKWNQKQDLSNVRITAKVPTEPFLRSLTRAHRCRSEHWLCFFMYPGPGSRQLHWFCPETHK